MKPMPIDFFTDMEDQGATVSMDVDDAEDIFGGGDGPIASLERHRLADADFFNSFQDDFDDSDIN